MSYHLNSLYSPIGWFSWADAAELFVEAKKDPSKLRSFVNTVLGETWKEQGDAPDWRRLFERRETYDFNQVPKDGMFITAGVDVQKDRLECEIVAWGRDKQSWSLDYRVIPGDTSEDECWRELFSYLNETFPSSDGSPMPIRLMAIDSGYNTQTVYNWVRKFPPNRVIAVKGSDVQQTIVGVPHAVDVDARGRKIRRGVKVWTLGVSVIKTELYGWLRLNSPTKDDEEFPPGYCHFPEYDETYFKMLTAEQIVVRTTKSGGRRYEWAKVYERNESLDCRTYARAAASVVGLDRFKDEHWEAMKTQKLMNPAVSTHKPQFKRKHSRSQEDYWGSEADYWK